MTDVHGFILLLSALICHIHAIRAQFFYHPFALYRQQNLAPGQ